MEPVDLKHLSQPGQCRMCGAGPLTTPLDLGPQPLLNRFLADPEDEEVLIPLAWGQCSACALIQLKQPAPADLLRPTCDWLKYHEPEGHLDRLADLIMTLPGINHSSSAIGVSSKDDSLLERLASRSLKQTHGLDREGDLGLTQPLAGIETIQKALTMDLAMDWTRGHGPADLVLARHIWEHAEDPVGLMQALGALTGFKGYVVVEVPDSVQFLDNLDYCALWEEHGLYFTPHTFQNSLNLVGDLVDYQAFAYPFENALVGVVRVHESRPINPVRIDIPDQEWARWQDFVKKLPERRKYFRQKLAEIRQSRGKAALFGAGHLAAAFVNILELKSEFEYVVDDHPSKQGLHLPGSRLPIKPSADLFANGIRSCWLSLSPENQVKVKARHQEFLEKGGEFVSIFSGASVRPELNRDRGGLVS